MVKAGIPVYGEMKAGQDLVLAGYIALWGTSVLASAGEARLAGRFTARFIRRCQKVYESMGISVPPKRCGAASWYLPGEGGVMAALWDYLSHFGLGFEIDLKKLTVLQETIEVCEVFDLNPYRLHAGGCLLFTADNGGTLAGNLRRGGIRAAVAGRITGDIGRRIINGEIQSFLDRPKPDELYKIVKRSEDEGGRV